MQIDTDFGSQVGPLLLGGSTVFFLTLVWFVELGELVAAGGNWDSSER